MSITWATILCFLILPPLVLLPFIWLERRLRIPEAVWQAYRKARAEGFWAQICQDHLGWFIVDQETGLVLFTDKPVVRGWSRGQWLVYDQTTGEILYHGKWKRSWVRYPLPNRRSGLFSLRE